jgi:ADP-ribose pyrophosphatase YjhB (NUDIX family)
MEEKRAARTVIIDNNEGKLKVAIVSVRNGEYFKIPGGGIETGETQEQAAIREAKEETGCDVNLIKEIGRSSFVDENSVTHYSVCFLAEKKNDGEPLFSDWEKSNSFNVNWISLEEAKSLFEGSKTNDPFGKLINERDYQFLLIAYKELDVE